MLPSERIISSFGAFFPLRVLVNLIGEVKIYLLADWEFDLDRIELGDGRQQRGRADQVSDLRLCDPGDAVNRRSHLRPLLVELRGLDRRLGRRHRGRTGASRLGDVIEILAADHLLLVERRVFVEVLLVLLVVGLLLAKVAERLVERRLVLAIVYLEQQLAGVHLVTVPVVLLQQVAGDFRIDIRVYESFSGPHRLRIDGNVPLDNVSDHNFRKRRCDRRRCSFAARRNNGHRCRENPRNNASGRGRLRS